MSATVPDSKVNAEDVLQNWASLNNAMPALSEDQCWVLLEAERAGHRRTQFLLRLYGRANKLRGKRERLDLFK